MSNLRLVVLGTALAALALLLVAGVAQANQNPTAIQLKINAIEEAIPPLSGMRQMRIEGVYSGTAGITTVPTTISLRVDNPLSWAITSVTPSTLQVAPFAQPGAQFNEAFTATLLVATTADAPAFTPGELKVTADAAENVDLKSSTATATAPVTAAFYSIIDAQTANTIQIARPQTQVVYPITILNYGNAQTKVFFEITDKPEGWNVQTPTPITLESKQQGGKLTSQVINLNILTPYHNGYLNEVGAVTMKVTSNYALKVSEKGDSTVVSVLTTNRGFYVPGFEALFGIAAIAGVALVARRRA